MIAEVAPCAAQVLFSDSAMRNNVWLFVADELGQQASPSVKYKKIWWRVSRQYGLPGNLPVLEHEFELNGHVRYAMVTKIDVGNFGGALRIIANEAAFMLVTKQAIDSESAVGKLFAEAFPFENRLPATRVRWANLINERCMNGEVLVKTSGHFDLAEYSVDFLGLSEILSALRSRVEEYFAQV
jgi:hypothetical protein